MYIINTYNTTANDIRAEPVGEFMSRCTRKTKSQKGQYSACITNVETRPEIGVVPIQRTVTSNIHTRPITTAFQPAVFIFNGHVTFRVCV
jgi:hypothetical protein